MKKTFLAIACGLVLFAHDVMAQKKPKKDTAPSVERSSLPKETKLVAGKQSGPAEIDANISVNYGALHHHLPVGSIILVRNPKNEKTIMVEVVGKITDRNAMYILKLSTPAAEKIGAEGKQFAVEIEYDDKGGTTIIDKPNTNPEPNTNPTTTGAQTHVVKSGDTLSQLAKSYGITVAEIKRANGGIKGDKIKIGQKLKIPAPKTKTKK